MCKRNSPMNMKQLEHILLQTRAYFQVGGFADRPTDIEMTEKLNKAINYIRSRQRATKRRSAHFKFLADEQRDMLR